MPRYCTTGPGSASAWAGRSGIEAPILRPRPSAQPDLGEVQRPAVGFHRMQDEEHGVGRRIEDRFGVRQRLAALPKPRLDRIPGRGERPGPEVAGQHDGVAVDPRGHGACRRVDGVAAVGRRHEAARRQVEFAQHGAVARHRATSASRQRVPSAASQVGLSQPGRNCQRVPSAWAKASRLSASRQRAPGAVQAHDAPGAQRVCGIANGLVGIASGRIGVVARALAEATEPLDLGGVARVGPQSRIGLGIARRDPVKRAGAVHVFEPHGHRRRAPGRWRLGRSWAQPSNRTPAAAAKRAVLERDDA